MSAGRGGGITPPKVVELMQGKVELVGQSAVARETGLTRQTVQRYLQGIGEPTTSAYQKLANYFGESFIIEIHPQGDKPA